MKCDRCGLQSEVEEAFATEKSPIHRPRHFCPDCAVKRSTQLYILSIISIVLLGLFIFAIDPSSWAASWILVSFFLLFTLMPLIFIHELAHAVVARAVGLRVFGIAIGTGKTIWSGRFLGMDWVINTLPFGGSTAIGAPPGPYIRWRLFFVFVAGPASTILIALISFLLWIIVPPWIWMHRLLGPLMIANIVAAAGDWYPKKLTNNIATRGTDSWQLLHLPFLSQNEITEYHIAYFAGEALQAYRMNNLDTAKEWLDKALALDSDSPGLQNLLGIIQLACREYHIARQTLLHLLETENAKQPGLHYILLNNVAYLDALMHDPSLLPEADQFSMEALQHLPWLSSIVGTRGTVLVELGQPDEGIALLKKSMSMSADKRSKAVNACHIASGEIRRGNLDMARNYLASAKTLDPHCFLIGEVEAQITAKTMDDRP
jgi:predicted negative regulator of RcsB-dependent stress response